MGEALWRHERSIEFCSDQCPSAQAHIAPVGAGAGRLQGRHCSNGTGCIVRARNDNLHSLKTGFGSNIQAKASQGCARLDNGTKHSPGQTKSVEHFKRPHFFLWVKAL